MNRIWALLIAAIAFGLGTLSTHLPAVRAQGAAQVHITVVRRNRFSDHTQDGIQVPGEILGFTCTTPEGTEPTECYILSK